MTIVRAVRDEMRVPITMYKGRTTEKRKAAIGCAIVMLHEEGFSNPQIARHMRASVSYVDGRLRAIKRDEIINNELFKEAYLACIARLVAKER